MSIADLKLADRIFEKDELRKTPPRAEHDLTAGMLDHTAIHQLDRIFCEEEM